MTAPKLNELSQPQWAAALHAARMLRECNLDDADDRARFRAAKARLVELLPASAHPNDLIGQAVRWYALNDIAAAFAGVERPNAGMNHDNPREPVRANNAPGRNQ